MKYLYTSLIPYSAGFFNTGINAFASIPTFIMQASSHFFRLTIVGSAAENGGNASSEDILSTLSISTFNILNIVEWQNFSRPNLFLVFPAASRKLAPPRYKAAA